MIRITHCRSPGTLSSRHRLAISSSICHSDVQNRFYPPRVPRADLRPSRRSCGSPALTVVACGRRIHAPAPLTRLPGLLLHCSCSRLVYPRRWTQWLVHAVEPQLARGIPLPSPSLPEADSRAVEPQRSPTSLPSSLTLALHAELSHELSLPLRAGWRAAMHDDAASCAGRQSVTPAPVVRRPSPVPPNRCPAMLGRTRCLAVPGRRSPWSRAALGILLPKCVKQRGPHSTSYGTYRLDGRAVSISCWSEP